MSSHYREDLDRAVSFAGVDHEFFARVKAGELVDLAGRCLGRTERLAALDAGCGLGLVVRHLRGRFGSLAGTDLDADALAIAASENPGVRFEQAEPGRLPFEDGEFDLTFAMTVVQVIPPTERPAFVSELSRVTRPAGLVAIFEHNPLNPVTRLVVRRFDSPDEIRLLTRRETVEILRRAGLQPVEDGYYLTFPSRHRRVVGAERALRRLPLGAQFYVGARTPAL